MFRYILYAILIYIVYLAIKWAFRLGALSQKKTKIDKSGKSKIDLKNIEDAEFTEVKKE
ncbi:MAG TPA: hypothetical protein VGK25_04655 [Ignavibacteria bacterium]|jgi:hypothetical protein